MQRGEGAAGRPEGCGSLIPCPDGAREGSTQESLAAGVDVACGGGGVWQRRGCSMESFAFPDQISLVISRFSSVNLFFVWALSI
ncbi:hypothetical protein Nmel_014503 [Mimus melanotis]